MHKVGNCKTGIKAVLISATLFSSFGFTSCFTGIETTSKINLSKKDIETVKPTEEELLLSDIKYESLKDWNIGKPFLVTDEKFSILVEGLGDSQINAGDTISFLRAESAASAGGGGMTRILFQTDYGIVSYHLEKDITVASESINSTNLGMIIDLEMVDQVRKKLKGRNVWTRSALWYDNNQNYKKGKKFYKVEIDDISAGNNFFPLRVEFSNGEDRGYFLMNLGNSGNESRNFGKLFSLTDPKESYKNITEENWEAIQSEQVRIGMTKEECRLARGNPSDVDLGHNYSNTMEIWLYPDGAYLQFVDGLLINYK